MSDEYEYVLKAIGPDGTVVSESSPRVRSEPFRWALGVSLLMLRQRHPGIVGVQLRRRAGTEDPWEPVIRDARNVATEEETP